MIKRLYADQQPRADAIATDGVARFIAWLAARAKDALPPDQRAAAGASPVTYVRLVSAYALPVSATAKGAERRMAATIELTDTDGRIESFTAHVRASEMPPLRAHATVWVRASTRPSARARATTPDRVQVTTLGPATVVGSSILQDPATGKTYRTLATTKFAAAGKGTLDIAEDSPLEIADTTHGAPLTLVSPPPNVMSQATVFRMHSVAIPFGTKLVDRASGARYVVAPSATTPSVEKIAGYSEVEMPLLLDAGRPVAPGTPLEFETRIPGVAAAAPLTSNVTARVPRDSLLRDTAKGALYRVTVDVPLDDGIVAFAPVEALVEGAAGDLTALDIMTFEPPVPGVAKLGFVWDASPADAFPIALAPATVGAPLDLDAYIAKEPDGRWSATVGTRPLGT